MTLFDLRPLFQESNQGVQEEPVYCVLALSIFNLISVTHITLLGGVHE